MAQEMALREEFDKSTLETQRAALIAVDHALIAEEYGITSPQAKMVRELYAAAMADAAFQGKIVPPLEPLVEVTTGEAPAP